MTIRLNSIELGAANSASISAIVGIASEKSKALIIDSNVPARRHGPEHPKSAITLPALLSPFKGRPGSFARSTQVISTTRRSVAVLPARFRNAGNQPLRRKFTKCDPGQTKSADETAPAATLFASIDNASRTGVPGKLRQTFVVPLRLEFGADRGVLCHRLLLPFVPFNPRLLCHREGGILADKRLISTNFPAAPENSD